MHGHMVDANDFINDTYMYIHLHMFLKYMAYVCNLVVIFVSGT